MCIYCRTSSYYIMINYHSTVCVLLNVMPVFGQLLLPLDARMLKGSTCPCLSSAAFFICTFVVGLLHNDCLYCVWLSVTCKYTICVSVWFWLLVSHNPVSSTVRYIY